MKYFEELMDWIGGFLKEMLDNFRALLTAIDNSAIAIKGAVDTYEENTQA